jgi:hypothetical protein
MPVVRPLILLAQPRQRVPHPSRCLRRVGAMPHAAPVLTLRKSHGTRSNVPALAKNARTGHPQLLNEQEKTIVGKGWATHYKRAPLSE